MTRPEIKNEQKEKALRFRRGRKEGRERGSGSGSASGGATWSERGGRTSKGSSGALTSCGCENDSFLPSAQMTAAAGASAKVAAPEKVHEEKTMDCPFRRRWRRRTKEIGSAVGERDLI